ncbi:uncharacterized protein EV420DRAFT_1653421 [Desarmillaria tabescens]|uniref:Uncharacterized protein n=1 Tax=Armillaria tabescens TaxID=1929756 RepID=A0AA39MIJ4_ARMTA|nr:uncharacterized protein EV420DRAFT_1653421 [Desarmillaria tabescens]KAK0435123.1 hypothetical protein EV420DRAFT_1653421 [Desarmillaria tabescens]
MIAAKFKVSTPLTVASNNTSKRKRSIQAGASDEQPSAKQSRSASETDDEAFEFVNYVYIRKKDPPKARKSTSQSNGKINYDLYIEKGPFKFMSNKSFEDYITAIATTLQCHRSKLILDELKYKQKVPQTSQIHSLTSELAFTALVEEMRAAKTVNKRIMYVFSPAPMRPASDEAWWTTTNEDGQESAPSGFDFSQLEWQGTEDSIATQKKKFDEAVRPLIVKLEEKFPVDNFPTLFPGRRVYKNTAGYYFDLDPGALSSWASHWARGTASEDAPPNNAYFDAKKRLHPPKTPPAHADTAKQANNTAPMPIPTPAVPTISDVPFGGNLLEYFLLQQQQQQQQHQQFQQMLQLQMLQNTRSSLSRPPSIPSAPPSPAKMPVVSLEAFCAHYGVNDTDHDRLQELGYTPGNKDIKTLEQVDWTGVGFPALSWRSILAKHDAFIKDAKLGLWME